MLYIFSLLTIYIYGVYTCIVSQIFFAISCENIKEFEERQKFYMILQYLQQLS